MNTAAVEGQQSVELHAFPAVLETTDDACTAERQFQSSGAASVR